MFPKVGAHELLLGQLKEARTFYGGKRPALWFADEMEGSCFYATVVVDAEIATDLEGSEEQVKHGVMMQQLSPQFSPVSELPPAELVLASHIEQCMLAMPP